MEAWEHDAYAPEVLPIWKYEYAYVLGHLYCVLLVYLGISHGSYAFSDFGSEIQPRELF